MKKKKKPTHIHILEWLCILAFYIYKYISDRGRGNYNLYILVLLNY